MNEETQNMHSAVTQLAKMVTEKDARIKELEAQLNLLNAEKNADCKAIPLLTVEERKEMSAAGGFIGMIEVSQLGECGRLDFRVKKTLIFGHRMDTR